MDIKIIKEQIIEALNLEEIKPEDFADDAPLFGPDGLGLDSIDALELIVMLEKNYAIKISNPKEAKEVFASAKSIAEYVEANRKL